MDGSSAVSPIGMAVAAWQRRGGVRGRFRIAVIKWFNRPRGFGFLTQGEGTHICSYGISDGPKELMPVEARPLDAVLPRPH